MRNKRNNIPEKNLSLQARWNLKLLLEPIVLEPVKKNMEKLNGWRFNSLKRVHQLINFADNYHKLNYRTRAIVYFLLHFSVRLILQTIYVLRNLGLKSKFIIKSGL